MTDPVRLIDGGTAFGRAMLRSAGDEAPPADLRRKLHAAVLVGAVGAAGAAGAGGASSLGVASAATKASSVVASLTLTKVVLVGVVAAAVTAGASVVVRSTQVTRAAPAVAVVASTSRPQPPRAVEARSIARAVPWHDVVPPAPAEPAPLTQAVSATTAPAASARPSPRLGEPHDFGAEVAALDAARAALAAGDPDAALEALDRHDRAFPRGDLGPESLATRIEAYAARHDAARVTELSARFRDEYPTHPFAARLAAIVEAASTNR